MPTSIIHQCFSLTSNITQDKLPLSPQTYMQWSLMVVQIIAEAKEFCEEETATDEEKGTLVYLSKMAEDKISITIPEQNPSAAITSEELQNHLITTMHSINCVMYTICEILPYTLCYLEKNEVN